MLGDSVRRRQPGARRQPKDPAAPKPLRKWRALLIGLPLALLAPFGIGYLVAVFVLFPPREVSAAGVPVPDLAGRSEGDAQRALAGAGLALLEVTELPHPLVPAGSVIAQSPLPGQQLRPGAGVRIALSGGRPRALVPDVIGYTADRARSLLERTGFEITFVTVQSVAAAGRVIRTEPVPGQSRELPSTITVMVSSGAPPPDTMARDTVDTMDQD